MGTNSSTATGDGGFRFHSAVDEMSREDQLRKVNAEGMALARFPDEARMDKEIVMAAVKQNAFAIRHSLCTDADILLAAVNQDGQVLFGFNRGGDFDFSSEGSEDIFLAALRQTSAVYHQVVKLRTITAANNDDKLVDIMVSHGYSAVRTVLEQIKQANRDRALALITINPIVFEFISKDLRDDRDLVLAAVSQSWKMIRYASDELKNDPKLMMVAVKQGGGALRYASDSIKKRREVVMTAIKADPAAFSYADPSLSYDRELVMTAVKRFGRMLEYACEPLRDDYEVVLAAMMVDRRSLQFASQSMREGKLQKYIENMIRRYNMKPDMYLSGFVLGIASKSDFDQIPLHKLEHLGEEALSEFVKEVADYAGVKAGVRYEGLMSAYLSLKQPRAL